MSGPLDIFGIVDTGDLHIMINCAMPMHEAQKLQMATIQDAVFGPESSTFKLFEPR
jgi:hypothetical protein